jgi:hypothetical protein
MEVEGVEEEEEEEEEEGEDLQYSLHKDKLPCLMQPNPGK